MWSDGCYCLVVLLVRFSTSQIWFRLIFYIQ